MFQNYIKLAIRVLGRRKFFTAISLFGISFTLGILMVILSFIQSEMGTQKPLTFKEEFILVEQLRLQTKFYDTITTVDTIVDNGVTVYDTTFAYESRGAMMWNSNMNNGIAEEYLRDLNTVDYMTIFNDGAQYDLYVNGVKVTLNALYADPGYFDVFDHDLIAGRYLDHTDMEQANQVIVISTKGAELYFGTTENVLGREIEVDGKIFKVIGMYPHHGKIREFISPHIVMPYTIINAADQPTFYHGFYSVIYRKKSSVNASEVKKEIRERAKTIPMDHPTKPEGYEEIMLYPKSYDEMIAQGIYYDEDEEHSYIVMYWILRALLAFFIILPTLNLINLNVSRIMDRSSEIGVRKAFGAHQGNILSQFVIENIVQTILGGIIGLGLALLVINAINKGGVLGESTLQISPKFYFYSLILTIIFGILSGLLPAYKMSKLHITNALKSVKL